MSRRSSIAKKLFFIILLLSGYATRADSTYVLAKDALLAIVKTYHPLAVKADLQVQRAQAGIREARGGFDPVAGATLDRKTLDGKLYYSYLNPEVVIPTWYGVDIKAGLEEVAGDYTNPERTNGQLTYIGAKLPLNNLWFDKRRAVLRQAQSTKLLTVAERRNAINDLLYNALATYWNWQREYRLYSILNNTVRISQQRLRFVITEYEQGTRPLIDTVEAYAQLQQFKTMQEAAKLSYLNAGLELSTFLWLDGNTPFPWSDAILPGDTLTARPGIELPPVATMLEAAATHPKIQAYERKIDILETERRLKATYLAPKVSVSGNLLSKGYNLPPTLSSPFLENNYKLGAGISMPLLLREARGAYTAAKLKLVETGADQRQAGLEIQNKVKSYYNEVLAMQRQIELYTEATEAYRRLLRGEQLKFEVGESNLFLLNSRENKLMEAEQKLADLYAKWHKGFAGLLWAAGTLQ